MNIEQAKTIPLDQILDKIGSRPVRRRGQQSAYLSPLRSEKTPSFYIHHEKNLWYDFGIGKGGNVINFACAYLESCKESCTISDGLRWLKNMSGNAPTIKAVSFTETAKDDHQLILRSVKALNHPALVKYIQSRGIPLRLASSYLSELRIHNQESKKYFFALGFLNEDEGYEIRNQFFKGCIGAKTISFIRGKKPKPDGIHLFEGFMDFLSALAYLKLKRFDDDVIVLNSLSCLKHATPYIKSYGYKIAYSWLDNDDAGQRATDALAEFFATEEDLRHEAKNGVYHSHKDVNAWHMNSLGLSP